MVQVNERTQQHLMGYQSPSSGLLRDFTPLKGDRLKLPCLSKAEADNHVSHCSAFEIGSVAVAKEFSASQETRIEVGVSIGKVINEEASNENTRMEGPSLIDEESLFFMGDEVGELTLGYYDGVGDEECLLDFQVAEDKLVQHNQSQKMTIRRTIATTISPANRMKSPCGVYTPFDFDWIEQQQIYRRKSFKPKNLISASPIDNFNTESPNVKGQHSTYSVETSPSALRMESDVYDVYPDTPSHSKNALRFLEIRDIVSSTLESRISDHRTDNDEVKTSLPEPDTIWYNSFFGAETRTHAAQARLRSARNGSIRLMSRMSALSFHKSWNRAGAASSAKILSLDDVLSNEELLALSGYKDHGNGRAEC